MDLLCCHRKYSVEKEKSNKARKISRSIGRQLKQAHKAEWKCLKLLLLGTGESGKSTVLKQMKIIHIHGYTEEERQAFVTHVRNNVRDAMLSLLGGMRVLGMEFEDSEHILLARLLREGSLCKDGVYTQEFYDIIVRLWNNALIQKVYKRANQYQLLDSAKYFLDRINVIRQENYTPSDQDILRCRTMTDGINEIRFAIHTNTKKSVHFRVLDVSGQRGARKKWIQLFDNVTAILFVVDTSSFDQVLREDASQNRLVDSLEVFEQAWNNKYLRSVPMVVFLNKIDVLDEKISQGQRITKLHTFVANWLDAYELRKCNLAQYAINDSREFAGDALCDSQLSCQSNASSSIETSFQLPLSPHPLRTPLRKIEEDTPAELSSDSLHTIQMVNSPTRKAFPSRTKRFSFQSAPHRQWRRGSLSRALNMLTAKHVANKFRLSFRQAAFMPITSTPSSSGQSSRLSCTVAVVRLILDSPYNNFHPTDSEKREFFNVIQYIEYHASMSENGDDLSDIRELRPPHPETVRTACYVKHLFESLTRQKSTSNLDHEDQRQCLFYYTCAVNTDSVKHALECCQRFLIDGHKKRSKLI